MEQLYIICVDDQREVLSALSDDLAVFQKHLLIEECESAEEAHEVINELENNGEHIGVIITDHVMPGTTGVSFLAELKKNGSLKNTGKILLTGLADHQDTIQAINDTDIDSYIEKPWEKENLHTTIKKLLTRYIIKSGLDHTGRTEILDSQELYRLMQN